MGVMLLKIYENSMSKHKKLILYVLRELGAEDDYVSISIIKLAEFTNSSRNTVSRHIQDLEEIGLLSVRENKGKASNDYRLLF